MNVMEFAAARSTRMQDADAAILPYVNDAWSESEGEWDWDNVVVAAAQMWLDTFSNDAGDTAPGERLTDFQADLEAALAKTTSPEGGEVDPIQAERITEYVSTAAVNDATRAAADVTGEQLRWVTMRDEDVRSTHASANNQVRAANDTFDVGGAALRYPGDPKGPLNEVMNCRCVLVPASIGGAVMAAATLEPVVDEVDVDEEEEVDLDGEALVDDELEVPWHSVLAPEGVPTGDHRMFAKGAITWRELPLPLLYQYATSDGHGGSVRVGRIDEVWKTDDGQVRGRGVFNGTQDAQNVITGLMDGSIKGVSVDVDDIELDYEASNEMDGITPDIENEGQLLVQSMVFSKARIAGLTIVAIPAYQEAYIALGGAFEDELTDDDKAALAACGCDQLEPDEEFAAIVASAFAPGTKDGPGWLTNPRATSRIRRYWTHGKGAAKIRWGAPGDFNRCRRQLAKYVKNPEYLAGTCANMHKEALGIWPGMERGGRRLNLTALAPAVTLTAAGSATYSIADFQNPQLEGPTAITVDGSRIYGHLAAWGVCHIGIPGVCTTAPHSYTGYAYFRTGVVDTIEGEEVPVGQITMNTGHASLKASHQAAAAHYDNTGSVVADVAAGEDAHGIWIAGALRPGITDEQRRGLQAAALSGDWRDIAGNLELVAALAVNVPGFPVPRSGLAASGTTQTSLVAAGIVEHQPVFTSRGVEEIAAIARTAVQEYRHQEEMADRAKKMAPARDRLRELRIAEARKQLATKEA